MGNDPLWLARTSEDTIVVGGRIDTASSADFASLLADATKETAPSQPLLIHMGSVAYLSSSGLRVLLNLRKRWKGSITLADVPRPVYSVLELSGSPKCLRCEESRAKYLWKDVKSWGEESRGAFTE